MSNPFDGFGYGGLNNGYLRSLFNIADIERPALDPLSALKLKREKLVEEITKRIVEVQQLDALIAHIEANPELAEIAQKIKEAL